MECRVLATLASKGVTALESLRGFDPFRLPAGPGHVRRGQALINGLGVAFRKWCRERGIERPPAHWDMHLIGRGENDSKTAYPVLESGVKAAHTKPILFYLSEVANEIHRLCGCDCPQIRL